MGFSFAMLLLGAPGAAIAVVASTAFFAQVLDQRGLLRIVFNTAQITLSLSLGAMCLFAFELHGPVIDSELELSGWFGIALSAVIIFSSNVIVACHPLALLEGVPFADVVRRALKVSIATDSAMLLLAPVLVASATDVVAPVAVAPRRHHPHVPHGASGIPQQPRGWSRFS